MSDLAKYAALKRVTVRTVARWCVDRKIPSYRQGGRWHLHPLLIQREENLKAFRAHFGDGSDRDKLALKVSLIRRDIHDSRNSADLLAREPEQWRFVYLNYRHDPDAYALAAEPSATLRINAAWLRFIGKEVTTKTLAREVGISVASLYRHYAKNDIRKALNLGRADTQDWYQQNGTRGIARRKWTGNIDTDDDKLRCLVI